MIGNAEVYLKQGNEYFEKGQYDEAILNFNHALEISPEYAEAYVMRGKAYDKKGGYDHAIKDFNRALEINPEYAEVYYHLGLTYKQKGQYDEAISNYDKALEINPRMKKVYGYLFRKLNNTDIEMEIDYEDYIAKYEDEVVRFLTPSDLPEIVKDELEKLSLGQILFNPSEEMQFGAKERVEVRIAKTITEDLTKGLKGRGVPQIEKIKVGTFMKVRLTGDNFDIKAISHEEQLVEGEGFTHWDWDVVPLKSGTQSLLLTVTVRIKIPDYGEEKKDHPVFEKQIKVKVNLIYSTKHFTKSYWQWIVGTIFGSGIIGYFVKNWLAQK